MLDGHNTHTMREISHQPELWMKIWDDIAREKSQLEKFLTVADQRLKRVVLTGAGTSAFIGLSLKGSFNRKFKIPTEAISTTDIVSHPQTYFYNNEPTLVISFARSGNSPESVAAVELADKLNENCHHLIITCNEEGQLAKYKSRNNKYVYILPIEANDKSLAMTSSYTGMLLSCLLITKIDQLEQIKPQLITACKYARKIISEYGTLLAKVATLPFKRAVFLGSGPQYGTAKESQLKLQELTDGKVICKHDSYLGFRHGPKAVIDSETLIVYLFSNDPYVSRYELDLVKAMSQGQKALFELGVMESDVGDLNLDMAIVLTDNGKKIDEELLTLCNVIPGQMIGFYKALFFNLSPDNPSVSGAISRVVEGVNIYKF